MQLSHYPSNLISVKKMQLLTSAIDKLQPILYLHSHHVSNPSKHSLILFTLQLFFFHIPAFCSKTFPFVSLLSHFSNISSQAYSLSFSLHYLYGYTQYNVISTTAFSHLYPILYCRSHFSAFPTSCTSHSFSVPHPFHILHPLWLATPSTENNLLPITARHSI